jgi:replicative superfamily II helicase
MVSLFPTIYFDTEPDTSVNYFLLEAEKWLSSRDYKIISGIDMNNVSPNKLDTKFLKEYKENENRFRSDLVSWRKANLVRKDYKPKFLPASLVKEGNPLQVEKNLLKFRWDYLEEKEQEHHFDLDTLIIYYLKMQILQRLNQFNKEKGIEKFQLTCRIPT